MTHGHHRGSALLVVLGLMAFLTISAVAFSAYMRYSRAPSSFLRQTVSSRLLLKAALAEAINEIDSAIGNNPHPGVNTTSSRDENGNAVNYNSWVGRVYTGCSNSSDWVSSESTVTPLCFESLAYIPPPLVNEVRYYSRHSHAAEWEYLSFDVGRYVFCAVDVSDYFDINAIEADVPRSSDPESKVSLSYLFEAIEEDGSHSAANGGTLCSASAFDTFMGSLPQPSSGENLPLISIADWNLAMKNGGPFSTQPPFCTYLGGSASDGFYSQSDLTPFRQMTFVTDSYFPAASTATSSDSSSTEKTLYLSDDSSQPWTEDQLRNWSASACEVVANGSSEGLMRLAAHVPYAVSAALYDYLDADRVPCSLALPTIERVPMICGIQIEFTGAELAIKDAVEAADKYKYNPSDYQKQATRTTTKTIRYNLDGSKLNLGVAKVRALVTYPFRHGDEVSSDGCEYDGVMLLYLTSEDMGLRPVDAVARLKTLDTDAFATASVKDGIITLPLSASDKPGFKSDMDSESDAVKSLELSVSLGNVLTELSKPENALFSAILELNQTADPIDSQDLSKGYNWSNPKPVKDDEIEDCGQTTVKSAECKLTPLKADGSIDANYQKSASDLFKLFRDGGADLKLNVAVVIRVKRNDEVAGLKVVDMVPACGGCDEVFNHTQNGSGLAADAIRAIAGEGTPLLRFDTGASFKWGRKGFADAVQTPSKVTIAPAVAMVGDPRYNYAPEHWHKYDGDLSPDNWVEDCGAHNADGDIFIQTSDQCRLQSVYELANLPRIGENGLSALGDEYRGKLKEPASGGGNSRKTFGSKDDALNDEFMWKTYDPFGRYTDRTEEDDGFAALRIAAGGNGFRINPYSDSTNILMAVFANTPHDWRCASTDNKEITVDKASSFNPKYAWNQYSSGAKLDWLDLEDVAGEFMDEIRKNHAGDKYEEPWEEAFRCLEWRTAEDGTDSEKYILDGLDLADGCKVFNTDRKFLYGFWHDCFSARQQLFLIFVRAEPVMMGGGLIGQTPPQLGARAVALVWRDPAKTTADSSGVVRPHRSRILFYRQFD